MATPTLKHLPRYTVDDSVTDMALASFYGPNAEKWAGEFLDKLPEVETGRYGFSVSDDGCETCGEMFWHEARELVDGKWTCPHCGAPEKEKHGQTTRVGS